MKLYVTTHFVHSNQIIIITITTTTTTIIIVVTAHAGSPVGQVLHLSMLIPTAANPTVPESPISVQ